MEGSSTSDQDTGAKKAVNPFENLTRDDLIKKCRGLLGIAQKAKQAKDECHEENKKLKEQLNQVETQKLADKECLKVMQEVIDSLTEQKLKAAMRVDELEKIESGLRRELDGAALLREKMAVENEAFQRQIKRLTDENEELLGDLSGMEQKLQEGAAKINDLEEKTASVEQIKNILEQELQKLKNENNASGREEKLIRKLKLYKNKVQEISAKILLLKSDRKILMKTVKEYSEQVPKWQKELMNASEMLFSRTQALEKENVNVKQQCAEYAAQLDELSKRYAETKNEKDAVNAQLMELNQTILLNSQLQDENRKHLDDIRNLQLLITDQEEKFKQEQARKEESLQQRLQECENELIEKELEKKQLQLKVDSSLELEERFEKLQIANQTIVTDLQTKLQETLISKEKQFEEKLITEELHERITTLQSATKDLEGANTNLKAEIVTTTETLLQETSRRKQLEDEIGELKNSTAVESLTNQIQELEQLKNNLEEENRSLLKQIENLKSNDNLEIAENDLAELQNRYQSQVEELDNRNAELTELKEKVCKETLEKETALKNLEELQSCLDDLKKELETKNIQLLEFEQKLITKGDETHEKDLLSKAAMEDLQKQVSELSQGSQQLEEKTSQLSLTEQKLQQEYELTEKLQITLNEMKSKILEYENRSEENVREQKNIQKKLAESCSALETLQGHYDILTHQNQQLQATYSQLSQEYSVNKEELQTALSKFELVKLENSELLSELKEINEILKDRGGVISLQLSKISELEAQKATLQQRLNELDCPNVEELRLRVQELERVLTEKEAELNTLRDRDRNFDAQSDVMSTSTISRAEESARLRDIDDSFEEKYHKLRSLAVKLKKKVAEQTIQLQKYEKEREAGAVSKNLQSLQAEYDKLLDQLEAEKKNTERLETELKEAQEHLEKLQQEVETLNQVRSEVDNNKKDKSSLESTIREYKEQLQSLKREKEAFNLAKKEIDAENQKLKAALKIKEKQLSDELESQKELKAEVERSRLAAKKANVLNLEMEAYEKSLAELNKKLETKKTQVKELEGTIEAQEGTIKSLKSQIGLLEQSLSAERTHSQELKKNVDIQQEKLRVSEHQRGEVNVELAQLKIDFERIKLEMESNRVELSDTVTEKEKICGTFETEKSKLLKQVYCLENDVAELTTKIREKEQEIEDVRTEFTSYKIRAQSVLRQNQNKDSGKDRELEEEVQNLRKTLEHAQNKIQTFTNQISDLSKNCEELSNDKSRLQNRYKELHDLLEESRLQNESLLEENRRSNLNHQEALKTQRLQNETLVSCYKKQIEELQQKHSQDIETLQCRLSQSARDAPDSTDHRNNNHSLPTTGAYPRGQQITDEQKINLLLMEREEGEGSESTSSQNAITPRRKTSSSSQQQRGRSNRDLIPLDELLNSSFDDTSVYDVDDALPAVSPTVELQQTKDKLSKQESRVRHLTALLAEAEQDLAKLTQLNELLKEEVRRHERSIEREKHVHNSEYLKNVIFKFLTLNNGDEKLHLVPVLNTILKLSPEETQKLHNVAKGTESGGRGWSGILWN